MRDSMVKYANKLYRDESFLEALDIYSDISNGWGKGLFFANISLCEKRIKSLKMSVNGGVNIAYITDQNYLMPTYVSIFSLRENRDTSVVYFVNVIANGVSDSEVLTIRELSCEGFIVNVLMVNENNINFRIAKNGFHVSTTAVLKFRLPDFFNELDKILYIDGDTLINKDLVGLYKVNIDKYYAAVVEDIKPRLKYKPSMLEKLNINSHKGYFNSGMMLLNLKKMREDGKVGDLFEYRRNGLNFFMDQDAFNVVFRDKVKYLSCKNNLLMPLNEIFSLDEIKENYVGIAHLISFDELVKSASIVHFSSKQKPWRLTDMGHAHVWYKYYMNSKAYLKYFNVKHEIDRILFSKKIIVSLTSYPKRIDTVYLTIKSLLSQTFSPDKIILWLSPEQFPNKFDDLPKNLISCISDNFEIDWYRDILSFKKLIPTIEKYPEAIIVTADDDILYRKNWLRDLVFSYLQNPNFIHCHRAHRIDFDENGNVLPYKKWHRDVKNEKVSYKNFFTGCGGVLYPSGSLHNNVFKIEDFTRICKHGDDIWFWGMALLNGTKIKIVENGDWGLDHILGSQEVALWRDNDCNERNDVMLRNFFDMYPDAKNIALTDSICTTQECMKSLAQ
ncbi:MAG: glycosyltransferase family 8 protein [Campylobacteraceae bacterium]|jgi:lipopolysaccharide biosynthesis glycosyltransferase|nr:glycosyltransferase family 8 protein [Campylobacteraceae bacterium]